MGALLAFAAFACAAAAPPAPTGRPVGAVVPLSSAPGLYLDGRRVAAADWLAHKPALDRLTERFLSSVRPLFMLLPDERILPGTDDLAYHPVRDAAMFVDISAEKRRELNAHFAVSKPHEGIDVGARVTADGGKTIRFLGPALVYPLVAGARIDVHGGDYVSQRALYEDGPYALLLEVVYGHVAPARPGGAIGTLTGDDRWDAMARELWSLGSRKGNHVHLLVKGVNDLELEHYVERRRSQPERQDLLDYVKYRADFYNERLLPRLAHGR
jgi:hypothetical protein